MHDVAHPLYLTLEDGVLNMVDVEQLVSFTGAVQPLL